MQNSKKLGIGILLVLGIFLLTYVSATDSSQGTWKYNQLNTFVQPCSNANYITLDAIKTPTKTIIINENMTKVSSGTFVYNHTPTELGRYDFVGTSDGCEGSFATYLMVTNDSQTMTLPFILLYIFLLLFCIGMIYLSGKLYMKNPPEDDEAKLFRMKQKNGFMYYIELMKKKFYIIGSFGVYLFLLLFVVILNQVFFSVGLNELNELVKYAIIILSWGLIPFTLFWCVYVLWSFYRSTEKILKHQFGGFGRR